MVDVDPVIPYFADLMKLLISLSADANFRVSLTTFELMSELIDKVGSEVKLFVSSFFPDLIEVCAGLV